MQLRRPHFQLCKWPDREAVAAADARSVFVLPCHFLHAVPRQSRFHFLNIQWNLSREQDHTNQDAHHHVRHAPAVSLQQARHAGLAERPVLHRQDLFGRCELSVHRICDERFERAGSRVPAGFQNFVKAVETVLPKSTTFTRDLLRLILDTSGNASNRLVIVDTETTPIAAQLRTQTPPPSFAPPATPVIEQPRQPLRRVQHSAG